QVFCNPANPRHNDEAIPHVAASIRRFGWRQPIVAKRSGEVVAGNTRLKAAKSLGMKKVPLTWFEGPEIEATAYSIADNKVAEFASWDEQALGKLLNDLRAEDALEGIGFLDSEIDELNEQLSNMDVQVNEIEDPGVEERVLSASLHDPP
ncbi:MAG: ParB N-terminal domain-containing protein, partial [Anaerolineales bacterium]|nr:ParB N-terminal domain-containing protein [Anaerolineales bacterium]